MKRIGVLTLAFSYCLLQVHQCSCETNGLTCVIQNLEAVEEKITNMAEKITLLENNLQKTEREVLELRSRVKGTPQVAFSTVLRDSGGGNIGPFSTATPLKYKKVFSNTGNGYNPSTGVFTAMVKGMYFLRFTMFASVSPVPNSVVSLMKNGERLVSVWDTSGSDIHDTGSNAVVIPLEVGDNVYVELQANKLVFDDAMNYNTFAGFLLFTM